MAHKVAGKGPGWDEIGRMAGEKVESEWGNGKWKDKYAWHGGCGCGKDRGSGFAGRLIFAIGTLLILNRLGVLAGIPWWLQALTALGFTLMTF